jgi:hypothetical protein
MRRLSWLLLLLPVTACDDTPKAGTGPRTPVAPKPDTPAALPTTGTPKLREMREGILEEVVRMEKELEEGKAPARDGLERAKKGLSIVETAARQAVAQEAEQTLRVRHADLRTRHAEIVKERVDLFEGIGEIETFLSEIERGVGKPPEGFTEDELKDRLGELRLKAGELDKAEAELRTQSEEMEKVLKSGEIPPPGETLLTQELEAVEELRARVERLEARLK